MVVLMVTKGREGTVRRTRVRRAMMRHTGG
jgi:hypothetical protein